MTRVCREDRLIGGRGLPRLPLSLQPLSPRQEFGRCRRHLLFSRFRLEDIEEF